MAQAFITSYTDDLTGDALSPDQATTVSWSWRGVDYELDTGAEHLAALEADDQSVTLGRLLACSRRVGGRRHPARPIGGRTNAAAGSTTEGSAAAVRAWATANGMPVEGRGRIPQHIRDAYDNRD
ncbi:MAG: Lsr2 family protein [Rhodospirillales bacterium]|nr:Lsr2 family protein [Acetobacter sp.]